MVNTGFWIPEEPWICPTTWNCPWLLWTFLEFLLFWGFNCCINILENLALYLSSLLNLCEQNSPIKLFRFVCYSVYQSDLIFLLMVFLILVTHNNSAFSDVDLFVCSSFCSYLPDHFLIRFLRFFVRMIIDKAKGLFQSK